MAFWEQCDIEEVIPFDGFIVYDEKDVRWWMGYTEEGLKDFISTYKKKGIDIDSFRIFKEGKCIETVGEYWRRSKHE